MYTIHFTFFFFFFNDTATTEIYTLSLHDALPICGAAHSPSSPLTAAPTPSSIKSFAIFATTVIPWAGISTPTPFRKPSPRSEEHTSELQSQSNLVCRLLLEKKK